MFVEVSPWFILSQRFPYQLSEWHSLRLSELTVSIYFLLFPGRYDLRLPQTRCKACEATWSPGVDDLIRNDYWPATSHHSTVYATDVLFSFEELKMAAPGLSSQAFLRMLDQRTVRFGRVSICGNNCVTQGIILWGHDDDDDDRKYTWTFALFSSFAREKKI